MAPETRANRGRLFRLNAFSNLGANLHCIDDRRKVRRQSAGPEWSGYVRHQCHYGLCLRALREGTLWTRFLNRRSNLFLEHLGDLKEVTSDPNDPILVFFDVLRFLCRALIHPGTTIGIRYLPRQEPLLHKSSLVVPNVSVGCCRLNEQHAPQSSSQGLPETAREH